MNFWNDFLFSSFFCWLLACVLAFVRFECLVERARRTTATRQMFLDGGWYCSFLEFEIKCQWLALRVRRFSYLIDWSWQMYWHLFFSSSFHVSFFLLRCRCCCLLPFWPRLLSPTFLRTFFLHIISDDRLSILWCAHRMQASTWIVIMLTCNGSQQYDIN